MTEPGTGRTALARRAARAAAAWLLALLVVVPVPDRLPVPSDVSAATTTGAARIEPRHEAPAPAVGPAPDEEPAGDTAPDGVARPSAPYHHDLAHAGDRIRFKPGARVSVPFQPRANDDREVDGRLPLALPPAGATGREMRATTPDPSTFVDQPAGPAIAGRTLSATTTPPVQAGGLTAVVDSDGPGREVFGFLPYWQLGDRSTVLDWSTLSTVAYFSVGCTSSGGLLKRDADGSISTGWAGWTSARVTSIINRAHEHGTRVVLTITCFAWSGGGAATQASVLGSPAARATLARQIAAAVRDRGADGVNLDFEPILPGYADAFTALVRTVRRELDAVAPGYQLTFDAMATVGDQPIAEATGPGGADAVVVMGYDFRTSASSIAGSISPLRGPGYDLTDAIDAFLAETDASKIILAVPYYGRAWSTSSRQLHGATRNPDRYGEVAEPYYDQAAALAELHGRRYDRVEASPWTTYRKKTCTPHRGCLTTWRQLYFDDAASLTLRYDLINEAGLRGAGIWALGFDGARPELRAALAASFPVIEPAPVATRPARDPDAEGAASPGVLGMGGFARVVVDGLRLRSSPSLSGEILRYLGKGTALRIVGGPVRQDGFTWYEVAGPVHPGDDVASVEASGWVAAFGRGWTHAVPRRPVDPPAMTRG